MGLKQEHGWTDDRVATLKTLWITDGLTASQIARRLGGISRNAVIGKVHRLGLSGFRSPEVKRANYERGFRAMLDGQRAWREANPVLPRPPAPPRKIPKEDRAIPEPPVRRRALRLLPDAAARPAPPTGPRPTLAVVASPPEPTPLNLPLEALTTGKCRWPLGTGPYLFCGCATPDVTDPKQPYCAFHRFKAFDRGAPRPLKAVTRPSMGERRVTRSEMFRQAAGGR